MSASRPAPWSAWLSSPLGPFLLTTFGTTPPCSSVTAPFHSPPSVPSTQSTRRAPSPISLGTPAAFASSSCLAAHRPVPGRISSPIAKFSLSSASVTAPPLPILTPLLTSSPPPVRVTPPRWSSAASGFAPVTLRCVWLLRKWRKRSEENFEFLPFFLENKNKIKLLFSHLFYFYIVVSRRRQVQLD